MGLAAGSQVPARQNPSPLNNHTQMRKSAFLTIKALLTFTFFWMTTAVTLAQVNITEAKGWLESAYVKFNKYNGAKSYNVYVKGGQYSSYTKIDNELVRNYGSYGRADVVGLKAASNYAIKVVPVDNNGNEISSAAAEKTGLTVKNYSRAGFAHFNYSGVGAYNDDGTLKSNAKVLYLTAANAKTISLELSSGTFTGIQSILAAYEGGKVNIPLAVRIIGCINSGDVDSFGSSEEGLQIKGKSGYSVMDLTVEGIGDDATVKGFGFLLRNGKSVEFRNFAIIRCMDDGLSLDTKNSNVWIHNLDLFYGKQGSGDHVKGDGSVDLKADSKYVTVSYCHYWDTGKSNLFGMKSESGPNYISYDHNWFDHSDSRHPRIRTMSVHVWNNYFDNCAKYGVGVTYGASAFVENNYFKKTKKPMLSSLQGTDGLGDGTFSGENGGMIKSFGNYIDRNISNFSYLTQNNPASTGYDAYEVTYRNQTVPSSERTKAGNTAYDNFDTNASLMYAYTPDNATDVPTIVTGVYGAGRLGHGDISHSFSDNTGNETTDSNVDSELANKIDTYTSSFQGFFDDVNSGGENGGENGGDNGGGNGGENGGEVNPVSGETITCWFDKNATPSNSFFTVSGNGSNSKGEVTIDGTTYSTCLKIETATSVTFSTAQTMVMTLYFGPTETASIKINGTAIKGTGNTYTQTIEAGDYVLTKDKSVNLFFIKLEPVETQNDDPDPQDPDPQNPDPQDPNPQNPEPQPYVLTVSSAGVATMYLDFDAVIPDADFFIVATVKQLDGTTAILKHLKGEVIPANTGVMIFANQGSYTLVPSEEPPAESVESLLHGVLVDTPVNTVKANEDGAAIFVLSRGIQEYTGFKIVGSTVRTITANKAYLPVTQTIEAKSINISFGGQVTGIENLKSNLNDKSDFIFDLSGRRVYTPTQGIYIINGKKYIIK